MSETQKNLLFEIGTEEIPARMMLGILNQLKANSKQKLKENRLDFQEAQVYGTPRRLTLFVSGLEMAQQDLEEYIRGPSVDVAFDESGNPTKAAYGFAKSNGIDVNDLEIKNVKGKEYVFVISKTTGRASEEVLPSILEELIEAFDFPGKMFWESKDKKFIRPIRWLVALYGEKVLPVEFGSVKADKYSRGHRALTDRYIELDYPEDYFGKMKDNYIMVDHLERKQEIKEQLEEVVEKIDGKVKFDEELLNEVNFLVEWPTAILCEFSENFLDLPDRALTTFMEKHQRYFPVKDKEGNLLPYFVTVKNGDDRYLDEVKRGNEKVIKARLADAKFFYEEDKKKKLEANLEKLKSIVYREELGSVYQKQERMQGISENILDIIKAENNLREKALRACMLCKADLVTQMVFEFSNLQGYMGMEYARLEGEDEEVAQGIYEHYLPRHAGDELPTTMVGTVVSLADKIDNIASSFAIGVQPTGTQDPYALRRQALGVIHIILESKLFLPFRDLFNSALSLIPEKSLVASQDELLEEIMEFIKARAKTVFNDYNLEGDVINSVLDSEDNDMYRIYCRIKELQELKGSEVLENLFVVYNRVKNLANKAEGTKVEEELLESQVEKSLYDNYNEVKGKLDNHLNAGDNKAAIEELSGLKQTVDDFFDNVMVMVDDEKLKHNRLNLLYNTCQLFERMADFSKIKA